MPNPISGREHYMLNNVTAACNPNLTLTQNVNQHSQFTGRFALSHISQCQ